LAQVFKPTRPDELSDILCWAASTATALRVEGSGSKSGIGRPVQADHVLSLAGFAGVSLYEPGELVLTAGAGTPIADIATLLAKNRQMLAFEPPDYSRLLTKSIGSPMVGEDQTPVPTGTLGGIIAANISGPRRFLAGAARDHFLGFRAVNGRGEPFKAGGRVVKNVTGFDLPKLVAGSWGTLAALWEVTLKVLPAPELTQTLLILDLGPRAAGRLMSAATASAYVVTGVAHMSATVAARSAVLAAAGQSVTALRVEGPAPSVRHRMEGLKSLATTGNHYAELDSAASRLLWREIGDLTLLPRGNDRETWRLSLPPSAAAGVIAQIANAQAEVEWLQDQAGGTLWLSCPADTPAESIRSALLASGGHATLWSASPARRAEVPVFAPQPPALAALTQRVKNSFDPQAVLNPGRMYAGT
jgi:glycolate oxidase FAD binding subunit